MSGNKRHLYDLGLIMKFERRGLGPVVNPPFRKFEDSKVAEAYERLEEPFNPERLKIGEQVAVLVDDDKEWVVGKITNLKSQGCIWATVPNSKPKSKAKPKQYVVCRIGGEERVYVVSYCFVQEKLK